MSTLAMRAAQSRQEGAGLQQAVLFWGRPAHTPYFLAMKFGVASKTAHTPQLASHRECHATGHCCRLGTSGDPAPLPLLFGEGFTPLNA